jgi:hypothetical protein
MLNQPISIALVLISLALFSCKKEEIVVCPVENNPVIGILRYTGPPESDGCDWLIEIKSKYYSPVGLPEQFKNKNAGDQRVVLTFEITTDKYSCGRLNAQYDKIGITGITHF